MICQPAIFVKGFPDARASSSVILVYGVTIRWLHFAHAQSNCTRPLDQKEVWPGDEANFQCALDSVLKELHQQGVGIVKKQAAVISDEIEEKL